MKLTRESSNKGVEARVRPSQAVQTLWAGGRLTGSLRNVGKAAGWEALFNEGEGQ